MCIALHRSILVLALAGTLVVMASCGGSSTTAVIPVSANPAVQGNDLSKGTSAIGGSGRTDQPTECLGVPGSGYETLPLITAGDVVPLLDGHGLNLDASKTLTYTMPGTPDGLGLLEWRNRYYVWVNHEFGNAVTSSFSPTVSGNLTGARVSLIAFDKNWRCLGGKSLIKRFVDSTGVIGTTTLSGNTVTQTGFAANRFCSSTLTTLYGGEPIYLTGEETSGGRPFAMYTNGDAVVINDLPRVAFENICPVSKYSRKTVLYANDDTSNAYLILYVGNRTGSDPNGFLTGTSYIAAVKSGGVLQANSAALVPGTEYDVQWVEVPRSYLGGDVYDTPANYYAWAATVGTKFMRPEDAGENPDKPGQLGFITTGTSGSYDNYGHTWRLDLANGSNPLAPAKLRALVVGAPGGILSPDNLTIDDNGRFWIQEDPAGTQSLMLADGRVSSIWNTDLLGNGLTRIFEVTQEDAPFLADAWETSGIVQVPGGGGKATVLFDVQAHDIRNPGGYVEGGQLLLGQPIRGGNGHNDDDDDHGHGHGHGKSCN